ncbi:hypothetical protein CF65_00291 [Aggregatibacter actinomycetemcomitans HK1651]|nr:hypothetical protein CF65_00291 [Aggregatibacter actinomycetemcomitans HK1651]
MPMTWFLVMATIRLKRIVFPNVFNGLKCGYYTTGFSR